MEVEVECVDCTRDNDPVSALRCLHGPISENKLFEFGRIDMQKTVFLSAPMRVEVVESEIFWIKYFQAKYNLVFTHRIVMTKIYM